MIERIRLFHGVRNVVHHRCFFVASSSAQGAYRFLLAVLGGRAVGASRVYPTYWAVALVVLIAATYRLWLPGGDFPRVPWFPFGSGGGWFGVVEAASLVSIVISALVVVVSGNRSRSAWLVIAGALVATMSIDQHRMQPWAYQSLIAAALFASLPWAETRRWLTVLAASIYVYSAAGKFDFQFAHTVGQEFLGTVAGLWGGLPEDVSQERRAVAALVFPATELLIGVGWLVPWTRRLAGCASIGMHVGLIGILGPWGLGHSAGVLVWNGVLIGQAWFLAVAPVAGDRDRREGSDTGSEGTAGSAVGLGGAEVRGGGSGADRQDRLGAAQPDRAGWVRWFARGVVVMAIGMPIFERTGYWDHWVSWSLYSPHTSRVEVQVSGVIEDRLADGTREALGPDRDGDGWRTLSLADWSLAARGVPIYPQARYQLGLAVVMTREADLDREIRGVRKGVADRWTGRREETPMLGREELERALQGFRFRPVKFEGFPRPPRR